ncbi:hypothetical protein HHI_16811 [Hyphomonas hirschiana VP5]|uniref:Lipoprotein n=1 Tax=Hyphomonas hirschiana VP5 TaxID=1280951 RepID=A0A059F827_9PROT|nr:MULTISPECIES: hypothetical protein [Hyphomonas]KCZ86731.1 hypothetical protein HHI_16811 [Hyphomonas hirschiana VP5]
MRKSVLGMSVAVVAGMALAACGNDPEPIAPVDPAFDRTTESTDTDDQDEMLPDTTMPESEAVPPVGSQPGEIPEVMEDDRFGQDEPRGDAAGEMLEDPEPTAEDPM